MSNRGANFQFRRIRVSFSVELRRFRPTAAQFVGTSLKYLFSLLPRRVLFCVVSPRRGSGEILLDAGT